MVSCARERRSRDGTKRHLVAHRMAELPQDQCAALCGALLVPPLPVNTAALLRRVQEVEETMAQVEPETGRRLPSQSMPRRSC